ncbi:MAG TPA: TIR domain-containing protein [Pyrinomonadaceae bacterium]|nr:TIR domain-containing protein [Pyrinomonadaceae bacterium]
MRDQVFISYSHKDRRWLERLQTHLKPFERTHRIQVWDDSDIEPGERWRSEIKEALAQARVAVLLVSPDYLASDFVASHELPPLLEASARDGLKILWVAVSASAYAETEIAEYQCVNDPSRPLNSLKSARLDEELVRICEAVTAAATEPDEDEEPAGTQEPEPPPPRRARLRAARAWLRPAYVLPALAAVLLVAALFGVGAFRRASREEPTPRPTPPPTVVAEFDDEFLNLEKWTPPPTGWRINMSQGAGSLEIADQPQVGYATGVAFENFGASFDLRLLDGRGAAWALRVNGPENYYLFYLSGPEGLYPNRFLSYVVRDGKPDPKSERSVNLVESLKAGQFYHVEVTAEGNRIVHTLTPAETGREIKLGAFVDPAGAYQRGSIGFRTVGGETFTVDDLWVHPPGAPAPR